jgi:hypothetical protein
MIQLIKDTAQEVGIALVITNSKERIETQLNSLTHKEEKGDSSSPSTVTRSTDLPIMLVSWDIDTSLNFNLNSFLDNPESKIVALLVRKADDLKKNSLEDASVEMGVLFTQFIQVLNGKLIPYMRSSTTPITQCGYKLVPRYGNGVHSGVLARWTMKIGLDVCE